MGKVDIRKEIVNKIKRVIKKKIDQGRGRGLGLDQEDHVLQFHDQGPDPFRKKVGKIEMEIKAYQGINQGVEAYLEVDRFLNLFLV